MSDSTDLDIELRDLLAELLDGSLDEHSRTRLNERLSKDPIAQNSYLDFCEAHAALAWEHGLVIADISPSNHARILPQPRSRNWKRMAAGFGAIAATLLLSLIWFSRDHGRSSKATMDQAVVAHLISRIDAAVTRDSASWNTDEIRVGKYEIARGLIQLQFASGVSVFIEAPAAFDAISPGRLALHSGRISANVPPQGTGFTVETPQADVVDFGTEFSIEVGSGESEVHVFKGHVQVMPRSGNATQPGKLIDLRTEQAIRIAESARQSVGIDLATDRFIRSIDEPQKEYPRLVKKLEPVAYYRMPIRERGLVCQPPEFDGKVLTGAGSHPACAPGIVGSSLRVGGQSIGRGAVVDHPPPLLSGSFAITCWVYATGRPDAATIVSDMQEEQGHFSLTLDQSTGMLMATVRNVQEQVVSCRDVERLALEKWYHVTITSDGRELTIYRDGVAVSAVTCLPIANSPATSLWVGAAGEDHGLWEGRIDELALFDKTLLPEQIKALYTAAPKR